MSTYVSYRMTPSGTAPVHRYADLNNTLFVFDSRATRLAIMAELTGLWTAQEQLDLRRAWGQPDTGPMADWLVADAPTILYVPPAARVPGEADLQGGAELERRRLAGELEHERAAQVDERCSRLLLGLGARPLSNYLTSLELAMNRLRPAL